MAKRLAGDGYAALVVNPYYRVVKGPLVEVGQNFRDPGVREKIIPYYRSLSQDTNRTDAKAFVAWLDKQDAVDTSRQIGTTGSQIELAQAQASTAADWQRINLTARTF